MIVTIILYLIGIIIGIYAIVHNLPFIFQVDFTDPSLGFAKLLQSLLPVIAGAVIVWVSSENLYLLIKKNYSSKEN